MGGKAPAAVRKTFVNLLGVCEVGVPGVCETTDGRPRPIVAVWNEQGTQIDVCRSCLAENLERGEWVEWEA